MQLAAVSLDYPSRDGLPKSETRVRVVQLLPFALEHEGRFSGAMPHPVS
jgi:hypothetical protein